MRRNLTIPTPPPATTLLAALAALLSVLLLAAPSPSNASAPTSPTSYNPSDTTDHDKPAAVAATHTGQLLTATSPSLVDITTYLNSGNTTQGTGIVLTSTGLVLTNTHVISSADTLTATDLADGTTYSAELVGSDPTHDIALIQLAGASGLSTAEFGDSETVTPGDWVASIGNAYGQGYPTISTGPVTRLGRTIHSTTDLHPNARPLTGLIEAENGVAPGESGGPMVNTLGQVIGVTVARELIPGSQDSDGTGFAIPINTALRIAHHLYIHHHGTTTRHNQLHSPITTR